MSKLQLHLVRYLKMRKQKSKIVFLALGIIFITQKIAAVSALFPEDYCLTPSKKAGSCILLKHCSSLLELLNQEKINPKTPSVYLRNSSCGFIGIDPLVCCEKETDVHLDLLTDQICGPVLPNKIIDSNKTELFEYPWMALIAYVVQNGSNFEYFCGGSIITKRYILTAAHCVVGLPDGILLLGVRVGDHSLLNNPDCSEKNVCAEIYQDLGIESIHYHPEYSNTNIQNDIALLRVNRDINFQPRNVRPICLPFDSVVTLPQDMAVVTGWGISPPFGPQIEELHQIRLPLVPHNMCIARYKGFQEIKETQICVSCKNEKKNYIGDSGGPLQATTFYIDNFRYVQYGISSFGTCSNERILVYTRVSYYMNWILNTIRKN